MKLESLVIADQHAAVNMLTGLVHTARQVLGIGLTLNDFFLYLTSFGSTFSGFPYEALY
jgi:hypothetical protein